MDVSGKARRRLENFQDLHLKIVDFNKGIVQIELQNAKILLAPSAPTPTKQGGEINLVGG